MHSATERRGRSAVVIGAGAFGLSATLELQNRGWSVHVVDSGPFPHPDAASNDISKIVRMDYGSDEFYVQLGERAIEGWLRWNLEWGWTAFHQVGFLILATGPMEPGQFEHDSYQMALARGRNVARVTDDDVRTRFSVWSPKWYPDGYINRDGGWSPSGAVISHLLKLAVDAGAQLTIGEVIGLESRESGPRIRLRGGESIAADRVVVASGSWSTVLLPELEGRVVASGQPVYHYKVSDPGRFQPPHFGPWAAGTATTGWYGFPALDDGTLKVANHGPGRLLDPQEPREVAPEWEAKFTEFLEQSLPAVAGAPIVKRRLCVYTDTHDSDFLIDQLPDRPGFVVATGGSGHGFKFAPVLGAIIADAVEGKENPARTRFGWREVGTPRIEPARWSGPAG